MATILDNQDRIRCEKEEWQGRFRPEIALGMTGVILLTLLAVVALIGWLMAG